MKLKFLGTGGGRYITGEQIRNTAGIVVKTDETQIHIDPGPGGLVYANKMLDNPLDTEAVIVSHAHLDHVNDADAVIEMAVESGEHPGKLLANETALKGYSDIDRQISTHHQELVSEVETLEEGSEHEVKDLEIEAQQMFHSDPKTAGFRIEDDEHCVGFWTDTEYSEELVPFYEDCDVMVVYCSRPKGKGVRSHTSVDNVPDIVEGTGAKTVIVTHMGYSFLVNEGVEKQKEYLDEEVDAKVIIADDGMDFPGNRSLGDF